MLDHINAKPLAAATLFESRGPGLPEFAEKYNVTTAHFTAIGALNGATLEWFDPQRKMYSRFPSTAQHEVIG